jgi:hypothetical protein
MRRRGRQGGELEDKGIEGVERNGDDGGCLGVFLVGTLAGGAFSGTDFGKFPSQIINTEESQARFPG